MHHYRVILHIDGTTQHTEECRAWIDIAGATLDGERELECRREQQTWVADFRVASSVRTAFYRVGIVASVGANWSLLIQDARTHAVFVSDGDAVVDEKTWLLGSWSPHRSTRELESGRSRFERYVASLD